MKDHKGIPLQSVRSTLLSKLEDGLLFFAERIASKIRKGALHPTLTTTLATPQDFTRRRGTLYPASKIEASILQPIIPTAGMGPRMCTKQHKASLRQVSAVVRIRVQWFIVDTYSTRWCWWPLLSPLLCLFRSFGRGKNALAVCSRASGR